MVHCEKATREWLNEEESLSPTVGLDSSREARDAMTADTPNAFTQTLMDKSDMEDQTIMKIT